jgi:dTDP-4-amino-4,6-dideoxygalactose transaminase
MTQGNKIPFIDLGRVARLAAGEGDVEADWADVLRRCEFVGGPRVERLERVLAEQLGVAHVVSCANGTDALMVGLQALGVRPGDIVALPNLTFWATYEAIVQIGARPLLIDVNPDDLQLDLDGLRAALGRHSVRAAMLVHLFGWTSARLDEIRALCAERNVALLEDGAQAYGVRVDGKPLFAAATMATLSFYPAKVIGGALDGGAILCSTAEQAALVRSLCNHGRSSHYSYAHVGWNSRMGGLQAAYLLRMCAHTDRILAARRTAAAWYRQRIAESPSLRSLRLHAPPRGVDENGYLLVARAAATGGAELARRLGEHGIGVGRTYPETMADQPPATGALTIGSLEVSRTFCREVINLPLFYGITVEEQEAAVRALEEVMK